MVKIRNIVLAGFLSLGTLIGVSIGPSSLPSKETMAFRYYAARYIATPYEQFIIDPFEERGWTNDDAHLGVLVEKARETMQSLNPGLKPGTPPVTVLKVSGTPAEMGYVYGTLLKEKIRQNSETMMEYVYARLWPRQLENAWQQVTSFIPDAYHEELEWISRASGVKLKTLQHLHVVAEIAEQSCSGLAVTNEASADGNSYHLRILDFATYLGVQQNPVIVFHEPRDAAGNKVGNSYVNVAWAGFHWSVGGINEKGLAIGEIGAGDGDEVEGERPDGIPMGIVNREVLNKSTTIAEAEEYIENASRNLRYVYVLSDENDASKVLSGPTLFMVTRPGEYLASQGEGYDPLPGFPGIIWHGAQHEKQIRLYTEKHDEFTLEDIMAHAKAVSLRKKSLHAWIYVREANELWVANGIGRTTRAVDQPYVHLDLDDYFGDVK